MKKMEHDVQRTNVWKKNRDRRGNEGETNMSQILHMTPVKGSRENLSTTVTVVKSCRESKSSPNNMTDTIEEWHRRDISRESITSFVSDPPVSRTPEDDHVWIKCSDV